MEKEFESLFKLKDFGTELRNTLLATMTKDDIFKALQIKSLPEYLKEK